MSAVNFIEGVHFVRKTYARAGEEGGAADLQVSCNEYFNLLNKYRIESDFSGYEGEWRRNSIYPSFQNVIRNSIIQSDADDILSFTDYIHQCINHRPKWFRNMQLDFDRNHSRFEVLVHEVDPISDAEFIPYYGRGEDRDEHTACAIARSVVTDVVLRLAYATKASNKRQFKEWRKKSFIILYSNIFGNTGQRPRPAARDGRTRDGRKRAQR